ncbi:proteasome regulatory particle base subunit rpn10 [Coemansia sp. RSA 2603]|nr:proteasome regulatory particle base subunit rpn10 [Coemansia sp. RSA 2603]
MVLEATVLIIDNSEWSRNGDYTPNRFQAQIDAVHYLFSIKRSDNPENTVGLIANAGDSPDVRVSLTADLGVMLKGMQGLQVRGESHFDTGIQIAQLVLKHRANKYQKQRIVAFVSSPIDADEKSLVKLGKKLKKNGVSIDVVNFGEQTSNEQKLTAFVDAANNNNTSHLVTIPPGPHVLSEQIRASPIVGEIQTGAGGSGGGGGGDFDFGMDADMDPELALALRMSLQEEEERQRREAAQQGGASNSGGVEGHVDDGDAMMEDIDEDEQIRRAIQMSLMESGGGGDDLNDQSDDVVASLLGSLPGVDPNDPDIQDALGSSDHSKNTGNGSENKDKSQE